MSKSIEIAGVQMTVCAGDANLECMRNQLQTIRNTNPNVELVLFSELCVYGSDPKWAETIPGKTSNLLCSLAREFGLWLVPGSMNEKTERGFYNTAIVINPEGTIVSKYRKIYPWRPLETSLSGDSFCVFEIPGKLKIGLCICYDQWFPEITRQLTYMGAELILCPTLTKTDDRPLELVLSQANAISNQVYFMNINGLGDGGNGHSIIVDPEGKIIAQKKDEEAVLTMTFEPKKVATTRETGTLGHCQVLKSFRDGNISFPVYHQTDGYRSNFPPLGMIKENKKSVF